MYLTAVCVSCSMVFQARQALQDLRGLLVHLQPSCPNNRS